MSLVARTLEAEGIPTVVIGSALDIMIEVGVPRALFVDFPLGNPCGQPGDTEGQRTIVNLALQLASSAAVQRTIVHAPAIWPTNSWRDHYMYVSDDNRAELRRAGDLRRAKQAAKTEESTGDLRAEPARSNETL